MYNKKIEKSDNVTRLKNYFKKLNKMLIMNPKNHKKKTKKQYTFFGMFYSHKN